MNTNQAKKSSGSYCRNPLLREPTLGTIAIPRKTRDKGSDRLLQGRWRRNGFNLDAKDAVAVHLQNGVAAAVEFKALATLGDLPQLRHDKAGQGFKAFFARQQDVVLGFQVAEIEAAIEHHGAR